MDALKSEDLLARTMVTKFISGSQLAQTFSPKKYSKANRAIKVLLNESNQWDCKVLTADDAKKMGKGHLAGDFVATNNKRIKVSTRVHGSLRKTTVEPRCINVQLRKEDIKTAHKSRLEFIV